jgi:hypothetical protein
MAPASARRTRAHDAGARVDFAPRCRLDLHKCSFETALSELSFVEEEAKYARKRLRSLGEAEARATPLMALPGSSYIQPEPKAWC